MSAAIGDVRMPVVAALEALHSARLVDQIVVTNQAAARVWPKLWRAALDFHYNPSTMGGAIPLALGLALAQPRRQLLVVSGDGSLLMSLGALVTVAGAGAANLTIVVLENRLYEVTGGQRTPGAPSLDLAAVARGSGFPAAERYCDLAVWRMAAAAMYAQPGPRFFALAVERTPAELLAGPTPPVEDQLATLRSALSA